MASEVGGGAYTLTRSCVIGSRGLSVAGGCGVELAASPTLWTGPEAGKD